MSSPPRKKMKLSMKYHLSKHSRDNCSAACNGSDQKIANSHVKGQMTDHVTIALPNQCFQELPLMVRLANMGRTCYLNSVLSALRFSPRFTELLHAISQRLICKSNLNATQKLVLELHEVYKSVCDKEKEAQINNCNSVFKPTRFLNALRDVMSKYDYNVQHDAQELMEFLLESVKEVSEEFNPQLEETVETLFQNKSQTCIHCFECENKIFREDSSWEFGIAASEFYVKSSKRSTRFNYSGLAKTVIASMNKCEILRDGNKYECGECLRLNEARKIVNPVYTPRIISIGLKHTTVPEFSTHSVKSQPSGYRIPRALPCLRHGCATNICKNPHHRSRLFAIICHHGISTSSGHYSTYIHLNEHTASHQRSPCCGYSHPADDRDDKLDTWIHIDDENISAVKDVQKIFANTTANTPCVLLYLASMAKR